MKKTRRQIAREKATIGVYQNLLTEQTLGEIDMFLKQEKVLNDDEELMEFSHWLVETVLKNKDSYKKMLSQYLKKGWTFDRLNTMERAILLIATCELLESDLSEKIVINEAIILAKEYCDEESYKFINGVLSQVV